MTIKEFIADRIKSMRERPAMWAGTKEAFGLQLLLLVELDHVREFAKHMPSTTQLKLMNQLFGPGNIVRNEPLDEEWAKKAALESLKLMIKAIKGD